MHLEPMASQHSLIFLCSLLVIFSLSVHRISAIKYEVIVENPKHPGCVKFQNIGGIPYTQKLLGTITNYLWSTILQQNTPADRKPIDVIKVIINDWLKGAEATTVGPTINVSATYLDIYRGPFTLKKEFESLMHHEMTHSFQWIGEGTTPATLVEGIADYTILKANLYPPAFMPPGAGDRWDKGYDYTARFLEYCDTLVPNFVAKLNKMMRNHYDPSYFKTLTGKPVEQLWREYKAKYPGVNK